MSQVPTHKGGPFYEWYLSVYGYAPPATVDSNATRYLAWQQGLPKALAATIPYGSMGPPGASLAGSAIIAPTTVTTPSQPAPHPAPAATVLEAGTTQVAAPPPASSPVAVATAASALPLSGTALQIADILLQAGTDRNAPTVALAAILCAAAGETAFGTNPHTYEDNGAGYWGVLQGSLSAWPNPHDVAGQAQAFYTGVGPQGQTDFHYGAINLAKQGVTDPEEIAVRVEVPSIWPDDAYARNAGVSSAVLAQRGIDLLHALLPGLPTRGVSTQPENTPTPAPSTGGVFDTFKALNWAGDFENLWKNIQGGSNEAANMAKLYNANVIDKITYVHWH